MKIYSWNINWIRAIAKKWLIEWVKKEDPDILCLQEVKAFEDQIPKELEYLTQNYNLFWHSWKRPGYSWVAVFYKEKAISTKSHFEEITHFHEEWRVIEIKFKNFTLLNIYFPNGWTNAAWEEKLSYKLKFYDHFLTYINKLRSNWESIITCWDFNICHKEIDIARPKENVNSIGFLPIERAKIDEIIKAWYIDVFRHFNPDKKYEYTWWSYRAGARPRNVWWRLDYFFISPDLIKKVKKVKNLTDIMGSDHCPVYLEI